MNDFFTDDIAVEDHNLVTVLILTLTDLYKILLFLTEFASYDAVTEPPPQSLATEAGILSKDYRPNVGL